MSSTIIYRVVVARNASNPSILEITAVSQSSNCFPKPRRTDEPDWDIFKGDVTQPAEMARLTERLTELCRAADGCGLREGSRSFEGPAYYRLWIGRLSKVGVALPPVDLAAVRYERVARPEKTPPTVSRAGYLGKMVRFNSVCLRFTTTMDDIHYLSVVRIDDQGLCTVEYFDENKKLIGKGAKKWTKVYALLRSNAHRIENILPGIFSSPVLIRPYSETAEVVGIPHEEAPERLVVLQRFVDGDIELVRGNDGRKFFLNADGIDLHLTRNEFATREARAAGAIQPWDWIKGACVIIPAA